MSIILGIETSTKICSVAVTNGDKLLALEEEGGEYSHSEKLNLSIIELFKKNKLSFDKLDAIAISSGPGSYTGLRIGVSAAKGLCFALNKPLISIPTLDALANQVKINDGVIVSMLDARRMEVFSAIYDSNYHQIRETQAQILDENSFSNYLELGKVYFIGNGVEKTKTLISHPNAVFVEDKLPSANNMSLLAYTKYKINDTEDVAYFEPYYLKDFVALKPKKK